MCFEKVSSSSHNINREISNQHIIQYLLPPMFNCILIKIFINNKSIPRIASFVINGIVETKIWNTILRMTTFYRTHSDTIIKHHINNS